jgi:hypothetical protein
MFNTTEALLVEHFVEKDWLQDEFTKGCYSFLMGPGALTEYGPGKAFDFYRKILAK